MNSSNPVIIRKNTKIGQPDAESDDEYVLDCFVDSGVYDQAVNTRDQGSILLGRTGSGKSAIIRRIGESQTNVINISPEDLSFNYLSNSQIINFFENAGVILDAFYNLLWKHIFTVELLKRKYQIKNDTSQRAFLNKFESIFHKDKTKEKAINYLQQWGEAFWNETEYRVKEFTEKLETNLSASLETSSPAIKAAIGTSSKLSDEQKGEVIHRGQNIVNSIQIKELHDVIKLLSEEVFVDSSDRYYICLDRLDDDWVSDNVRFKLLKSLVETIRAFRTVQNVKIIVALRSDLYFSLIQRITSPGFQEEKYQSYYLNVRWSREKLHELIDKRINQMFRRQYTKEGLKSKDIFANELIDSRGGLDYILDRTFFRPREAIAFVNKCLDRVAGKSRITASMIRESEVPYSAERFKALCDEWRREYPYLRHFSALIQGGEPDFTFADIPVAKIEKVANNIFELFDENPSQFKSLVEEAAMDGSAKRNAFCGQLLCILYQTGVVGVKLSPNSSRIWSFDEQPIIDPSLLSDETKFSVHKTFHICLGIKYQNRR